MIKAFDRYVLKEIASPFGIGLLVYTFTLTIHNIFNLSNILISRGASAFTVLKIFIYLLPFLLSFTIPMSTLMGVLAGLSRMSTDSEIVAFRTMGVNNFRILKPVMLFSSITFLFSMWLLMYVTPEANFRLSKLYHQVIRASVLTDTKARTFNQFPFYTLYFNDIDNSTNEWKDVFLYSRKGGTSDTVITAKTGKFVQNTEDQKSYITLKRPIVHSFKKKEPEKSYSTTFYEQKKETILNYFVTKRMRKSTQLKYPFLISKLREEPKNIALSIEFHRKFALPFACLALGFLALSLGISTKKGGKINGFIISLGIIFMYYTISMVLENMALKGVVSPFIGMWSPDIFLFIVGMILYFYTSKEKTIEWEKLLNLFYSIKNKIKKGRKQKKTLKSKTLLVLKIRKVNFKILNIIDLYVIKKLILTFFLIFFSLIMIFYVIDIVDLLDDVFENNVPFLYVFKYIYYHTPEIISFVLPVSILTAVLLTFSLMSKNNEIVAVQVSGISLHRLSVPAVLIGILLSIVFFYVQENIAPEANKRARKTLNIIHKRDAKIDIEVDEYWKAGNNNEFYFYYRRKGNKYLGFNIIYMGDQFSIKKRISSKYAKWMNERELILYNGFERNLEKNIPIKRGFKEFNTKKIVIDEGEKFFTKKISFSQFMNIKDLKRYIKYLKKNKSDTKRYVAKLYNKYAFPFSSLVMVLIAIPFSFLMGNKGTLYGIGIAIGISMIFWSSFALFSSLGSYAILSPFISAFGPISLFSTASVYLFLQIKT